MLRISIVLFHFTRIQLKPDIFYYPFINLFVIQGLGRTKYLGASCFNLNERKGHERKLNTHIQKITSKRRTSFTSRFGEEARFIYYPFMNHYSHMTLHVYIYIYIFLHRMNQILTKCSNSSC